MKVGISYTDIWKVSYPVMLGALATTILNLTDTAFMSRVGETELAAIALGSIFHFLLYMIGFAISTGAQIIIARRSGEGERDEIRYVVDHTFIILVLTGIILFLTGFYLSPVLFDMIISAENVERASSEYLRIRSAGLIIGIAGLTFRSFFIGIGRTSIITLSAVLMTLLNIYLDFVFVFGWHGVNPMGIAGAAWASVIAEIFSVVVLAAYPFLKKRYRQYRLLRFSSIKEVHFKAIIDLSSPIVLQNLVSMSSWFIFFVLIEKMGQRELAISNVVRAVYMVLMTPIWGYASATNSMVSNIIGQKKTDQMWVLIKRTIMLSLGSTVLLMSADFLSGPFLLELTTSDTRLINDSLITYYIVLAAMVVFSISVIVFSAVSGSGNTKAAMLLEVINISIYLTYVYICTMVPGTSVETAWLAEVLYWSMMGLLSIVYFRFFEWKKAIV